MGTAAKFTFDTEFQGGADRPSADARARQRKTMTVQEIDELCAAARREGEASASARAAEALERAVAALTITLRAALDQSHAEIEALREETALFALSIAGKLAPAAIADQRLTFLLREAFPSVSTKTTLTEGNVNREAPLEVVSEMNEDGRIFGDGIEADAIDFRWGLRATISIAPSRLRLVKAA